MTKIAILSDRFPPYKGGGIAIASFNLFTLLKKSNYEVKVYTYLDILEDIDKSKTEDDIFRFGMTKKEKRLLSFKNFIIRKFKIWILREKASQGLAYQFNLIQLAQFGVEKINKHLKRFNPDIVISPDFGVPGKSLIKLKNVKYIHVSHNNPVRYLNNPLLGKYNEEDTFRAIAIEQKSLHKINAVICPSNYMKDVFERTFSFKGKVEVLPNLVDEEYIDNIYRESIHEIINLNKDYPIVYIPSAASPVKGERYIVEVVRRLSRDLNNKVGFYLSGGLNDIQEYELNKLKNKERIFIPGVIPYERNIAFIKSCSICISPTLLESFGMALMEAVFCELPCISFDVGGNREVIKDSYNGYLVPYLDVEQLIEKSIVVLTNENLMNELRSNIAVTVKGELSEKNILKKYQVFFNEILN